MPRLESEKIVRRHYWVYENDDDRFNYLFGGSGKIGKSKAIRTIMRQFLDKIEAKRAGAAKSVGGMSDDDFAAIAQSISVEPSDSGQP